MLGFQMRLCLQAADWGKRQALSLTFIADSKQTAQTLGGMLTLPTAIQNAHTHSHRGTYLVWFPLRKKSWTEAFGFWWFSVLIFSIWSWMSHNLPRLICIKCIVESFSENKFVFQRYSPVFLLFLNENHPAQRQICIHSHVPSWTWSSSGKKKTSITFRPNKFPVLWLFASKTSMQPNYEECGHSFCLKWLTFKLA